MEFRPDGSLVVQTALSMSGLSHEELSQEAAEITRLVRLTLGGDSTAFEQIILRYETRVMTMAARLLGARDDARDVAQEVFLRAFRYLHRLDLQRLMEPWLMRITVNVCRDAARRRQRRRDTFVDIEAPETIDQSPDPYDGLARKQERLILLRALESLPIITNEQFVQDREELETRLIVDLPKESRASRKERPALGSGMLIYGLTVGVPLTAILLYLALDSAVPSSVALNPCHGPPATWPSVSGGMRQLRATSWLSDLVPCTICASC